MFFLQDFENIIRHGRSHLLVSCICCFGDQVSYTSGVQLLCSLLKLAKNRATVIRLSVQVQLKTNASHDPSRPH